MISASSTPHNNLFKNHLERIMITHRQQVTDMIISAKVLKSIKWSDVAKEIELSKEWVTAACLGQMAFNKEQAEKIGQIFGLSNEAVAWLQIMSYCLASFYLIKPINLSCPEID